MLLNDFLNHFRIHKEKENFEVALKNVDEGVVFQGTNLWILIFAIFIASLGLNVNSPAVIIGAMLISPLMGPIIGVGLSVGINDIQLLRLSISNLLIAMLVALATSTTYFLISPLNEAHAELLARTSPTIYDVLIALFGGAAGALATFSKRKGNVIPGAAIATALMPPLCTAGYGLATLNMSFFFGAFYLFIINSVFIAYATLLTTRLLKFPVKHMMDHAAEMRSRKIVAAIVLLTLIPSIYLGYDIVQRDRFEKNANLFIEREGTLPNDYILNKKITPKSKKIELVYGGQKISKNEIESLKNKLAYYDLEGTELEIKQGFAYLNEEKEYSNPQISELSAALESKQFEINGLRLQLDSIYKQREKGPELFAELKVQYPNLVSLVFDANAQVVEDSLKYNLLPLMSIQFKPPFPGKSEKSKISHWLRVRLKQDSLKVIFE